MSNPRTSAVLFVVAAVLALPAGANALRSEQGKDYSEDFNAASQVRICDNESDGRGAYANYQIMGHGSLLRIDDGNGSESGCSETTGPARIYKHHACESINVRADACGPYVYP